MQNRAKIKVTLSFLSTIPLFLAYKRSCIAYIEPQQPNIASGANLETRLFKL